jgi:hypothetical protein
MVTHDPHAAEHAGSIVHLDKGQLGRIEHNKSAAPAAAGSSGGSSASLKAPR